LTFDTFEAKIDTIQSFDASSSMNPLGKVSSYNNDPNLPITQGKLATEDSSESSSNLLLNLYDSIFGSLRDFSEFIENIMNPITDIFYPLIDAISGAFYNFIIKFLIQGDFLIAQKVTLVAVLGYLSSLLGDKGDEIGGESGLDANKVRFNIPGINKSFKNGHLEMIFDVVALMLAAIQLDASNDVTNSLDALGKTDLANKLSYYSEFAWIIGFNNIGELAEDNGKMKSLKGIVDSTNQKANALEGFSEFIRIVANIDYLFHFSADVFQNTLGFGFKMSDGALFLGWMGFLANTGLNLILNLYGLYDNVVNFIPKTYSGKDQPNWMLNPSNRAELSSAMKKITIGITLVTLLGGLIGYAFASFNL
jgi:hypothetical protein